VVGRGTEADLRINDPGVSRRHLELEVSIDGVEAVDLGSTNGILVDGSKVARARLRDGSTIRIGHTEMTVRIDGGRDEAGGWNV
jgi:pSer/pThr/pTyr-binding forkhead associated (FHA) protein